MDGSKTVLMESLGMMLVPMLERISGMLVLNGILLGLLLVLVKWRLLLLRCGANVMVMKLLRIWSERAPLLKMICRIS